MHPYQNIEEYKKLAIIDFKLSPCPECCMLFLGDSPASKYYMPTFRNTLFHLHGQVCACRMNWAGDMFGDIIRGKVWLGNGLSH